MAKRPVKTIIFGATGLLGQALCDLFKKSKGIALIALGKDDAEITDRKSVTYVLKRHKPEVIINCAAYIGVEYCEKNPLQAWYVNALGPGVIINSLRKLGLVDTVFIQISTSDVFGNKKTLFWETDEPSPINVYGWSKYGGEKIAEQEARASGIPYFIIRTSWLYGDSRPTFIDLVVSTLRNKKNFAAVADQFSIPTWSRDVATALLKMVIDRKKYDSGIYHILNDGKVSKSKYEIAKEVANIICLEKKYLKKSSQKRIFMTNRPRNALLINSKLPQLPSWRTSLQEYLSMRYGKNR